MRNKMHGRSRGGMLLEVMVAGMMVAIAALGTAAALVSGIALEQRSERTLSEVVTAENILDQIRYESMNDFEEVSVTYRNASR